jgi:non-ribosomal peptide synthetase component E (peptide arylation enzyme)
MRVDVPGFPGRFTEEETARYRAAGLWGDHVLTDFLDKAAARYPGKLCVADPETSYSYREVRDRAYRLASGLASLGVGHGDRVAVQLPNWAEAVVTYFAVARLGAVFVPRMPIYREHEVRDALERTEAKALVVPDRFRSFDYASMGRALLEDLPGLEQLVVLGDVPEGGVAFDALLGHEPYDGPRPAADDIHIILFTSGTTARPKGVVHTWNTYHAAGKGLVWGYRLTPDDICLMPSPVMHNTGLLAGVVAPLLAAAGMVLQPVW